MTVKQTLSKISIYCTSNIFNILQTKFQTFLIKIFKIRSSNIFIIFQTLYIQNFRNGIPNIEHYALLEICGDKFSVEKCSLKMDFRFNSLKYKRSSYLCFLNSGSKTCFSFRLIILHSLNITMCLIISQFVQV